MENTYEQYNLKLQDSLNKAKADNEKKNETFEKDTAKKIATKDNELKNNQQKIVLLVRCLGQHI